MCDCDIYLAYDRCGCEESKNTDKDAYIKMLTSGYETMRQEVSDAAYQYSMLEKEHKAEISKLTTKYRNKMAAMQQEVAALKKSKTLTTTAATSQNGRIQRLEKKLEETEKAHKDKEDEFHGSRLMLRGLNNALTNQIHMLREENSCLKTILSQGTSSSLDTDLMSKSELKYRIGQLEMELKETLEELDNKERIINSAALANSVLRQQLSKR